MSKRSIQRSHKRELEAEQKRGSRRRKTTLGAGIVLGAGALFAPNAQAATFTVTNLADAGPGSLRDAITSANADPASDTINFQSGLSGQIDLTGGALQVQTPMDIEGPGAAQITLDGGDTDRIFYVSMLTSGDPVRISGLTMANGLAAAGSGGAIASYFTALTLDSVVVRDSYATTGGFGPSKYGGGGIGAFGSPSSLTVTGSQILDNGSGHYGGGIATAEIDGGVLVTGSTLSGNVADGYGGGAAFYDQHSDVTVEKSTVSGNDGGTGDGGGIWFEDTYNGFTTSVIDSTVKGNTTDSDGGGVSFGENFSGPSKVVNSTITGNDAGSGGGVQFADLEYGYGPPDGSFSLLDSTVTANHASDTAGGVLRGYSNGNPSDSNLTISSTAIAGNTAVNSSPDIGQGSAAAGTLTLTNSLLQDPAGATYTADPAGSNIVGADPQLGALADNGGPTQTQLPAATSPLIDAGLANGLTTDQRGLPRTADNTLVPATHGSDGTDIGSVELPPPDVEVIDPVVEADSPQFEGPNKIKVKLRAGAGEDVSVNAFGRIRAKKGFPVVKVNTTATKGNLVKIVLKPRKEKDAEKIERSLANGKKVTAKVRVKLKDAAGNLFQKDLSIKLKAKAGKK
jgi:hypothetical protein